MILQLRHGGELGRWEQCGGRGCFWNKDVSILRFYHYFLKWALYNRGYIVMQALWDTQHRLLLHNNSQSSPKKRSLPRTELSRERRTHRSPPLHQILHTQPAEMYQLNLPSPTTKTSLRPQRNNKATTLASPSKKSTHSPSRFTQFHSRTALVSQKHIKTQFPTSPMSIREMNQIKEKMKLETEAKQAFLRLVSSERAEEVGSSREKTTEMREYLKTEFERGYQAQYQDYFSNNYRKPQARPRRLAEEQRVDFRFLRNINQYKERVPVLITLQSNILPKQPLQYEPPLEDPFYSPMYDPQDQNLSLQSQIHLSKVGLDPNVQRQRMDCLSSVASIISEELSKRNQENNGPLRNSRVFDSPSQKHDFIESYGLGNPVDRQSFHRSVFFQPQSAVLGSESNGSRLRSRMTSSRLNFHRHNSNFSNQNSQTQEQPLIMDKIDEYLHILDMFVTNICEFEDLISEPNSVSGIVNFYLYKRFLKEKKRLQQCLMGGFNMFQNLDYYDVTDQEIKEYIQQPEGRDLIKQMEIENDDAERKLRTVLDFLRRQLGKEFPKADVSLEQPFEIELRYYLRMESEQIKNKLQPNSQSAKVPRLTQRLVFLYESIFLITFFNGKFVKNYHLYQEISDLKAYLNEYQDLFETLVQNPPK